VTARESAGPALLALIILPPNLANSEQYTTMLWSCTHCRPLLILSPPNSARQIWVDIPWTLPRKQSTLNIICS
ncbi:hypothetical protein C8R45DRAFT_1037359, partial [Mycena sanguinolenta]